MENNLITSLCYVYNKTDKTTLLCRIADYKNETFVPYPYDPNREFYGNDRDLLYGQNYEVLAEEGTIGIFDWYAYLNSDNQWRTYVKKNNDISWCEVINFGKYDSPTKIAAEIKTGMPFSYKFDGAHDLVLVSKTDSMGLNALLLRAGTVKTKDNQLVFMDDVIKIPVGAISMKTSTLSCQCRYLKTDQHYLRWPNGFTPMKQYNIKKPVEVVRDIIQGNISYFDSGILSRKEKQLLRGVLARITEPTIVDLICDKMKCSVQDAHTYINQYIETANIKLEKQKALSIMEKLIESDVDAVLEMKKAVKEEWLLENDALVAEKKKEIEHYTEVLHTAQDLANEENERIKNSAQAEEKKLNRLKEKNEELTESVEGLQKLKEELEREIQDRINRAKDNLAGSMLDRALMMPAIQMQQPVVGETKALKTFAVRYHQEETEEADIDICHDAAQTDWNLLCGDNELASGLALLALAAFACNQSILVAGEGAEEIADMLSVSVSGHKPLKVHIRTETDIDAMVAEVEAQNHQIICVINGLESGYTAARELMEHFRDSRFIFTAIHGESLAMEPESLFSTFFPILTDYFYNGKYVQEPSTLDCSGKLLQLAGSEEEKNAYREAKRNVAKWLKDEYFPPLFRKRFAKLVAAMTLLGRKLKMGNTALHTAELELVVTPWLKCIRRTELLQGILEGDNNLDDDRKKDLLNYIGADGM